jgi:hypothetical protein
MTPAEMTREAKRAAWRASWHRTQWKRWVAQILAEGLETCPARSGHTVCGTPLENRLVNGETVPHCPRCERKRRRECLDCGISVADQAPRALYCAACRRLHRFDVTAKSRATHRERSTQAYRAKSPEARARHNELSALYRLAHPTATARSIARQRERRQANPGVLARIREASKASRERVKAGLAKRERYTDAGERLCRTPDCATVMRHTKQRWCAPCRAARVRAARQALTGGVSPFQPTRAAS